MTIARRYPLALCLVASLGFGLPATHAQLVDSTQAFPGVPGGQINKSLAGQVGAGHGDINTLGSAVYLIKRDPARSIRRGRQLFQRKFTTEQGLGPRVSRDSTGDIHANAAIGAGLVDSCAGCHGRPRGSAGFGGDVVTRPDSRDAPHLFGLGLQEQLADEITRDLRTIEGRARSMAVKSGAPVTLSLQSKSITYGTLRAFPDGTVDHSRVRGVDSDLRIRPFFAEGREFSIRAFTVGAFNDEMGLQAPDPVLCAATDPNGATAQVTPAGLHLDPVTDSLNRPAVCSPGDDRDGDGVANEVDAALVDHMEFYLLNYFKPGVGRTTENSEFGRRLLQLIGCTSCHVPDLSISNDRRVADVETRHDPTRGIFNRLFATASTRFKTVDDGDAYPQVVPLGESFMVRNIYTDFRRHDLGPAFHERRYDGSLETMFMTEPLWGVGSTSPYGHDGRSINLEEVILRHGGEAQPSRNIFAALKEGQREAILDFLNTLILFPPDDTASNLNPGKPGTGSPQDPAEHGSINLGALFLIPSEGAE